MKITNDKEADALYIEFSNAEWDSNKKIDDSTIVDLDKEGNIIGIEILRVSKRISKDFLKDVTVKDISLKN